MKSILYTLKDMKIGGNTIKELMDDLGHPEPHRQLFPLPMADYDIPLQMGEDFLQHWSSAGSFVGFESFVNTLALDISPCLWKFSAFRTL